MRFQLLINKRAVDVKTGFCAVDAQSGVLIVISFALIGMNVLIVQNINLACVPLHYDLES